MTLGQTAHVPISRDDAAALDADDPLAPWRDEFLVPDAQLIYLDGNSLGRPPRRSVERIERVLRDEWAGELIAGWQHWLHEPSRVGEMLAPLIGARPGEVVVHDSTTVNLYQLVHAGLAMHPERRTVLVADGEFPTDRDVVHGVAAATGHRVGDLSEGLHDDVALVVRSLVDYRTAELADLAGFTASARAAGATVLWDLSHAAGAVELDLHGAGAELAVGCTYKYLNGGPGSPAWSYVAAHLQPVLDQPMWGWFAQQDQFEMERPFDPHPDIRRLLLGTPAILSLAGAEGGIALTAEVGMPAIAAKGRALTGLLLELCDELGLPTSTPRDAYRRGAHVAVLHPRAGELVQRLASERNIVADYRPPDVIRLGCSALTTRYVDVWDAAHAVAEAGRGHLP